MAISLQQRQHLVYINQFLRLCQQPFYYYMTSVGQFITEKDKGSIFFLFVLIYFKKSGLFFTAHASMNKNITASSPEPRWKTFETFPIPSMFGPFSVSPPLCHPVNTVNKALTEREKIEQSFSVRIRRCQTTPSHGV